MFANRAAVSDRTGETHSGGVYDIYKSLIGTPSPTLIAREALCDWCAEEEEHEGVFGLMFTDIDPGEKSFCRGCGCRVVWD